MSDSAPSSPTRKQVYAWALYDWANSAFATSVMATLFPIFFKLYWSKGEAATEVTFRLGVASSVSSIAIVVLAPILGAIADRGGARKKLLFTFAGLGIAMTGALGFLGEGQWLPAVSIYVAALIGFLGANVFYDSLIVGVSDEASVDRVSALGFGLGYLGGGLLLAAHFLLFSHYEALGIRDTAVATKVAIVSVAVWWAVFSVPIFLFVKEPPSQRAARGSALTEGFRQLAATFAEIKRLRVTLVFLLAYWLYIDGVDTIILMAADFATSLGLEQDAVLGAFLLTQFVGAPAAIGFGALASRIGAKAGIYIAIVVYCGVCVYAYFIRSTWEFYAMAITIGLVQGGVQSLSRSLYTRLVPPKKSGEFFGFYNMLGKFAAVVGPLLVGVVAKVSGNPRLPIVSIVLLFAAGLWVLRKVDLEAGQKAALEFDRAVR